VVPLKILCPRFYKSVLLNFYHLVWPSRRYLLLEWHICSDRTWCWASFQCFCHRGSSGLSQVARLPWNLESVAIPSFYPTNPHPLSPRVVFSDPVLFVMCKNEEAFVIVFLKSALMHSDETWLTFLNILFWNDCVLSAYKNWRGKHWPFSHIFHWPFSLLTEVIKEPNWTKISAC
jgi:hypothetical protein